MTNPNLDLKKIKFLNQDNKKLTLNDYMKTQGLIVFFYPLASSPGCALEARAFENHYNNFQKMGYDVVGISKSLVKSNKKFANNLNLSYDLIYDNYLQFAKYFKVKRLNVFVMPQTKRKTFILNKNFKIIKEWKSASIIRNAEDVYNYLKNLK